MVLAYRLVRLVAIEGAGESSWTLRILMGLLRFQSRLEPGVWLFRVTALMLRDLFAWSIRGVVLRSSRRMKGCGPIPSVHTERLYCQCEGVSFFTIAGETPAVFRLVRDSRLR